MSTIIKCCCCCCILIFLLVIVAFVGFFVLQQTIGPNFQPSYKVTDASLSKFNMTKNKTLDYNLYATISIRNPNKWLLDYHFERFEAIPFYNSLELSDVDLSPFEVKTGSEKLLHPSFKGPIQVSLGKDEASKMKGSKVFDILLKMIVKHSTKIGSLKVGDEFKVECMLKVPLSKSGEQFQSAKCNRS